MKDYFTFIALRGSQKWFLKESQNKIALKYSTLTEITLCQNVPNIIQAAFSAALPNISSHQPQLTAHGGRSLQASPGNLFIECPS